MTAVSRDLLEPIVAAVVQQERLDLEDLKLAQAGRRRLVKVIVDADDGVDLDRCAEVSRLISQRLDESDVMGAAAYTLEVSSPGVSRPLTLPRHWRRATGRLVRAALADGGEVTGRVTAAGEAASTLDVDGTARELAYADVLKARVQVEFTRSASSDDLSGDDLSDDHAEGE